jgi:hypothetical protein
MAPLSRQQREREVHQAEIHQDELIERITHAIRDDGTSELLPGLRLYRQSQPTERLHGVSTPSFCVIAQGSKEVYLGEECFRTTRPGTYWRRSRCPSLGKWSKRRRSDLISACGSL